MLSRRALVVCALLVSNFPSYAAADYEPVPGWGWYSSLVLEDATTNEVFELQTSYASYPSTCGSELQRQADLAEKRGGIVWTDKDRNIFGNQSEYTPVKNSLVGLKCVYRRSTTELNQPARRAP